jgi:hypothetical protein
MIQTLRQQLQDLIGTASHLDGLLAEGGKLADPEAARAYVKLARLQKGLRRLSDRVEAKLPVTGKGIETVI